MSICPGVGVGIDKFGKKSAFLEWLNFPKPNKLYQIITFAIHYFSRLLQYDARSRGIYLIDDVGSACNELFQVWLSHPEISEDVRCTSWVGAPSKFGLTLS